MEELSATTILLLCPIVLIIAGVYSSVGLGGGTAYLAVMALAGVKQTAMPSTALFLNIIVTGVSLWRFGISGRLKWRIFLPFLSPAIPMAFVGGLLSLERLIFLAVMGVILILVGILLFIGSKRSEKDLVEPSRRRLIAIAIPSGTIIGILSGFLGIGGGVFLGPLILLLRWAGPKEVSAMNSAVILTLSLVGLVAHGIKGAIELLLIIPLSISVVIGGLIGSYLAEKRLSTTAVQRVFSIIITIAGIKALYDAISSL